MLALFPSDLPIPRRSLPIPTDPHIVVGPLHMWEPLSFPCCPAGVPGPITPQPFRPPLLPFHVLPSRAGVPPIPLGVRGPPTNAW